ncbi:MAG: hypothetical protein JOZ73_10390 [Solirubrobacterales bacterium]|nr:hypothetical protein [Solirubrobacterales bacterium]
MRVVLATHSLAQTGGSESYALTVAHELRRLGHEITLAAQELGSVAELAEREGLHVTTVSGELPGTCDAVIVQDAIVTAPMVERYPHAPVVHVAHSPTFDHQLPLLAPPVIAAVVALSERVVNRIQALALDVPITRLRQPIDTDRFVEAGPLPARPRRALLLGNYLTGERRRVLVDGWSKAGVQCVQVGLSTCQELDVRPAIAAADIVVAKGRAVLEGMACARAVYVYDDYGGDGWITPQRYDALERDGFAGLGSGGPRTSADLAADLNAYRPEMGWVNRELVRTHHSAREHVARLVEVLRSVSGSTSDGATVAHELSRLWALKLHAEREAGLWRGRALDAETRLAEAHWLLGTRRVRAGFALGRAVDRFRKTG